MILITGGLGPTHDDITANSLYEYFNDDPIFDSSYWDKLNKIFTSKGLDVSNLNKSQAFIPKKGEIIPNNLGTARGLSYNHENVRIIAMPGVPKEMKSMMNESVNNVRYERKIMTQFMSEIVKYHFPDIKSFKVAKDLFK